MFFSGRSSSRTFAHADGAALPVLPVALAAVLVTGEGRTLYAATHLAAVLVPPVVGAGRKHRMMLVVETACDV